ncbi:MAG: hypothetical protein R3F56_20640 [Planctomycetota bacterium]
MTELTSPAPDWKRLHAFGLPGGSVRGLLAIAVAATVCAALVLSPQRQIPYYVQNVMFIVLGHYFAARHRPSLASDASPPPLYLPRGAIRFLLAIGFVAVAVLLFRQGRLLAIGDNPGVMSLFLVLGFLTGVLITRLVTRGKRRPSRAIEDLRATLSLVATVVLVFMVVGELQGLPDQGWIHDLHERLAHWRMQYVSAALVSFYFGSRS